MFIAFEGIEGAGKSTQLNLVAEALRRRSYDPVVTREPGGTRVGEAIRELLLDEDGPIDPWTETFLILAARSAFVRQVVRPALEAGRVVLTDRYDLSTLAYQGGGRGLPIDELRTLNAIATNGVTPTLYVVLDVEPGVGLGRGRAVRRDRIERENLEFHGRVAETYRELARSEPNVALVDGVGEIEDVFSAVWQRLSAHAPETFDPNEC